MWRICVLLRNLGLGHRRRWGVLPLHQQVRPTKGLPRALSSPRQGRRQARGWSGSPGPRQWGCAVRVSLSSYVTAYGCHGHWGRGNGPGSRMEAWSPPARARPSLSSSPPLGVMCQTPRIQCLGLSLSICETNPAPHGLGEMDGFRGIQDMLV